MWRKQCQSQCASGLARKINNTSVFTGADINNPSAGLNVSRRRIGWKHRQIWQQLECTGALHRYWTPARKHRACLVMATHVIERKVMLIVLNVGRHFIWMALWAQRVQGSNCSRYWSRWEVQNGQLPFHLQWTLDHEGGNDLQFVEEESTPYKAIDKISSSHKCGRKCTGWQ